MAKRASWATVAALFLALPVGGCYSLTQLRVSQVIRVADQRAVVGVWFMAPGHILSDGQVPVAEAAVALLLYPLDVLFSTMVAVRAPFDPDLDITWGPVGAAAGIALPWVTLVPHLYPPLCLLRPAPEVELSSSDFADLVARIRQGDGLAAYRALVAPELWACDRQTMMSVVLLVDPEDAAAPQGHAAGRPEAAGG